MFSIKQFFLTLTTIFFCATYVIIPKQTFCSTMISSKKVITVTDRDSSRTVKLAKGDTLAIKLEAQLGTGYGWQVVKSDTTRLKSLGEPLVEPGQGLPGGVEHQVFRFVALRSGSCTVELHYLRPWEKDTPPAKTYQIKVQIRKARSSTTKPSH